MDSKSKKWIIVMLAVLFVSAAAAGFRPEWKRTSAIGASKDYVAEIRIDGTIYGGPRNGTLLGASEGVSSEQVMYEMEQARKDNRVKSVLLRINSPGGSTGATQEIAEEMDKNVGTGYAKQVFVTTHSPFFVNALQPKQVWVLEKDSQGFSTIKRASDYRFVNDLVEEGVCLGDLWYDTYFG